MTTLESNGSECHRVKPDNNCRLLILLCTLCTGTTNDCDLEILSKTTRYFNLSFLNNLARWRKHVLRISYTKRVCVRWKKIVSVNQRLKIILKPKIKSRHKFYLSIGKPVLNRTTQVVIELFYVCINVWVVWLICYLLNDRFDCNVNVTLIDAIYMYIITRRYHVQCTCRW